MTGGACCAWTADGAGTIPGLSVTCGRSDRVANPSPVICKQLALPCCMVASPAMKRKQQRPRLGLSVCRRQLESLRADWSEATSWLAPGVPNVGAERRQPALRGIGDAPEAEEPRRPRSGLRDDERASPSQLFILAEIPLPLQPRSLNSISRSFFFFTSSCQSAVRRACFVEFFFTRALSTTFPSYGQTRTRTE